MTIFDTPIFEPNNDAFIQLRLGHTFRSSIEHERETLPTKPEVIHRFEAHILAKHLGSEIVTVYAPYKIPANTWQTFKRNNKTKWWMRWLVKRRPVVFVNHRAYTHVTLDHHHVFPEAEVYPKELGRPFRYSTHKEF